MSIQQHVYELVHTEPPASHELFKITSIGYDLYIVIRGPASKLRNASNMQVLYVNIMTACSYATEVQRAALIRVLDKCVT